MVSMTQLKTDFINTILAERNDGELDMCVK